METATEGIVGLPRQRTSHRCSHPHWQQLYAPSTADSTAAELATKMHDEAERLLDVTVSCIRSRVDGYDRAYAVKSDELAWSLHRNMEAALIAFAKQSSLTEEDLAICRELGRRRARQGIPLSQVTKAFRVGFESLWAGLTKFAGRCDAPAPEILLNRAGYLWRSFDEMTSAVEEAYRECDDAEGLGRKERACALLDGLREYPRNAEQTERHARALNLDPHAWFAVAVMSPGARPAAVDPGVVVVEQPEQSVVISNDAGEPSAPWQTMAGDNVPRRLAHLGIGLVRRGLAGARQSLADAEAAYRVAMTLGKSVVHYGDHWLSCLTLQHRAQLEPLVIPAVKVLRHDPELCRTLEAFLAADGNLTATGKALFVHPNTVGYRLKQFAQRAGIEPRSTSGIGLIQVALVFLRLDASSDSRPDG